MERWTALGISASFIVYGILDISLYALGGVDATISRVMLRISFKYPLVPICLVYSFGVLVRHLFFPMFTDEDPELADVIGRMCLILSPLAYVTAVVAINGGTARVNQQAVLAGGWWGFAAYIVLAFVAGLVAGRWLPQHLAPDAPLVIEDRQNPIIRSSQ